MNIDTTKNKWYHETNHYLIRGIVMKKYFAFVLSVVMMISSFCVMPMAGYAEDNAIVINQRVLASSSLAKPSGVKAVAKSSSSIKITWKKVKNANGYYIYRSTSKNKKYKKIATVKKGSTVTFTNKKLSPKKKYYYRIKAYKGKKTSPFSNTVSATTKKHSSKKHPAYGTISYSFPNTNDYDTWGWGYAEKTFTWEEHKEIEEGGYWTSETNSKMSAKDLDRFVNPNLKEPNRKGKKGEKVVKEIWVWLEK